MRSPKSLRLLLGFVAIVAVALMWAGCSDDSTPTSTTVTGDVDNADYQVVKEQVVTFADSTLAFVKNGLTTVSLLPTDTLVDPIQYGPIDPHQDSASSVYSGGWHVIFISRLKATYSTGMRDSIQFRDGDGAPQPNASGLASISYRRQWAFNTLDTTVDFANLTGNGNLEIDGLNTTQATVDGSNATEIHSRNYSTNPQLWPDRVRDITITSTMTDVVIDQSASGWSHSCPTSGTITCTVVMVTTDGESDPVTTTWTVTMVFDEGTAATTVRRANTVWTSDIHICDIPS